MAIAGTRTSGVMGWEHDRQHGGRVRRESQHRADDNRISLEYAAPEQRFLLGGTRSTISMTKPGLPAGHPTGRGVARFLRPTAPPGGAVLQRRQTEHSVAHY